MIKLKVSLQDLRNLNEPVLFFIQVAIIFACTRAVQDISYSYLPLFLTDSLDFQKVCVNFTQLPCYDYVSPTKTAKTLTNQPTNQEQILKLNKTDN